MPGEKCLGPYLVAGEATAKLSLMMSMCQDRLAPRRCAIVPINVVVVVQNDELELQRGAVVVKVKPVPSAGQLTKGGKDPWEYEDLPQHVFSYFQIQFTFPLYVLST